MLGSPLPPGGDLFQRKLVNKQQMWAAKQGGPSQVGFRDSWQVARKAAPHPPKGQDVGTQSRETELDPVRYTLACPNP